VWFGWSSEGNEKSLEKSCMICVGAEFLSPDIVPPSKSTMLLLVNLVPKEL